MSTKNNALFDIPLDDGTTLYLSKTTTIYNGRLYRGIIKDASLLMPVSFDGEYEVSNCRITIIDIDDTIRKVLSSSGTKQIKSNKVKIRDAGGTLIVTLIVTGIEYGDNIVIMEFTDRFDALEKKQAVNDFQKIKKSNFPDFDRNYGETINFFSGSFLTWGIPLLKKKNALTALRVKPDVYVLGKPGTRTTILTGTPGGLQLVTYFDTTTDTEIDITSSCTVSLIDGIYYISYVGLPADVNFITVNFYTENYLTIRDIVDDISDAFFPYTPLVTPILDNAYDYPYNQFHYNSIPSLRGTNHDNHFVLSELINGKELLSKISISLYLQHYLDEDGRIVLTNFYNSLGTFSLNSIAPETAQTFIESSASDTDSGQVNSLTSSYGPSEDQSKTVTQNNESRVNIKYWVSKENDIMFKGPESGNDYLPAISEYVHAVAIRELKTSKYSRRERSFAVPSSICRDWELFTFKKFKHKSFEDDIEHVLLIIRIDYEEFGVMRRIDFIDFSDYINFSKWMVFSLESDTNVVSAEFRDRSNRGFNYIYGVSSTLRHNPAITDSGYSAIEFQSSNSDYILYGNSERYQNFSPWQDEQVFTSFSVWMKIQFPILTELVYICGCWVDLDNYWTIFKRSSASGNTIKLVMRDGGITNINIESSVAITDSNSHEIVVIKIGAYYSIYIDGQQTSYDIGSSGDIPAGLLLGAQFSGTTFDSFSNMNLHVLRFYRDAYGPNLTPLSPNAGLTDSYPVSTNRSGDCRGERY